MTEYNPSTYGDAIADVYDQWTQHSERGVADGPTMAAVDFLAKRAGDGPVLELGVGTGRIAIPLAERDFTVVGVEASEAMVGRLRDKPGGDRVQIHIGDMAALELPDETYTLAYAVASTFFAITTQEDQLRCFRRIADVLVPGGTLVIETGVPDMSGYSGGQRMDVLYIGADEVRLHFSQHNPMTQTTRSQLVAFTNEGVRLYPVFMRYAAPSELDLMAEQAGFTLTDRWAGWNGEPFTPASTNHVSVYTKRGPTAND